MVKGTTTRCPFFSVDLGQIGLRDVLIVGGQAVFTRRILMLAAMEALPARDGEGHHDALSLLQRGLGSDRNARCPDCRRASRFHTPNIDACRNGSIARTRW